VFVLAPVIAFSLALVGWLRVSCSFNFISFDCRILFFLCCVGIGVYFLLASGWSSNSKYALLGALRGVAQTISYEVALVLILFSPIVLSLSYDWSILQYWQINCWFTIILFPRRIAFLYLV
jgi:NADH:ubiquinone oxidoreductase subunit H